ncbi:MAG: energy-coupling factor ABC transporter ATP-binding protein [Candidatus Omnitrophota bacterium]
MNNRAIIELKGVTFVYEEGTTALDDIDFYANKGEFVCLLASNGSGKTTLLKTIVALLRPQRGRVLLEGQPLYSLPQRELYQKIGMVFQDPDDQLFAPTVGEDVAFGPKNMGLSVGETEQRVSAALSAVGMSGERLRAIHHLSFGQKKRACIAGVLAMRPRILVLDEPTAGLDPAGEADLMRLLGRLNKEEGITIIMATHMVDLLPLFSDRLYVLSGGRVAREGPPEKVFCGSRQMEDASLRLPYISHLIEDLRHKDKVPLNGLPLTIGEARRRLVEVIL